MTETERYEAERLLWQLCPCCNRTFGRLASHMKTKHPNYADSVEPGDLREAKEL